MKANIYYDLDGPDWRPSVLGSYGPAGLNAAKTETSRTVLLELYDRSKLRMVLAPCFVPYVHLNLAMYVATGYKTCDDESCWQTHLL